MVLCMLSTEKLPMPRCRASSRAAATVGAVVSKPMPANTTSRPGSAAAISTASRGEYTTRTSAPVARSAARLLRDAGTRNRSPNVTIVTRGNLARAIDAIEVTHGRDAHGTARP